MTPDYDAARDFLRRTLPDAWEATPCDSPEEARVERAFIAAAEAAKAVLAEPLLMDRSEYGHSRREVQNAVALLDSVTGLLPGAMELAESWRAALPSSLAERDAERAMIRAAAALRSAIPTPDEETTR